MTAGTIGSIVLAGGTSRRFGSDKLRHPVGDRTLLAEALVGLPAGTAIIVVGPEPDRSEFPAVRSVRENPVGGGPAAALVTGLQAGLAAGFDVLLVLPGDAPMAGHAASELFAVLQANPGVDAVLGVDPSGREQPLQLALRPTAASALIAAAGETRGAGASVRRLVHTLKAPPLRQPLSDAAVFDIDTPAQLAVWLLRDSVDVDQILAAVRGLVPEGRPKVVAIDGPSTAGTSTLAAALTLRTPAVVVPSDDFYTGPAGSDDRTDAELVATSTDLRRLRAEALGPLLEGRAAVYRPYDRQAADGRPTRPRRLEPQPLVILEGVYAARPELRDVVDLVVHVDQPGPADLS